MRKKGVDKWGMGWYSNKAVGESRGGDTESRKKQDFPKKVLDKAGPMWYPKQVVCKDGERQTVSKNVKNVEKTS